MTERRRGMVFADAIRELGLVNPIGVEVGVNRGWVSETLLREVPDLTLILCDPWAEGGYFDWRPGVWPRAYKEAMVRTEFAWQRRIIFPGTSEQLASMLRWSVVDFAIIDAARTVDEHNQYLQYWWPKVRYWMAGRYRHPNVMQAVDEFKAAEPVIRGKTWWLHKPR